MAVMDITHHPEVAVHLFSALGALGLGLFILYGRKGSTAPDPGRAKVMFERACNLGDAVACERLERLGR